MKKLCIFLFCLFLGIGWVSAQTTKVTGTVTYADDGEPIIGASVLVKGTKIAAVTDIDGKFALDVPGDAKTLFITYLGMISREIAVAPMVNVAMKTDNQLLDEVVVTGYGTTKKSVYSGAASVIDAKKLADIPAMSMNAMLQGNASGVMVTSGTNQPGAVADVRIRGMGSINASKSPLYVIDGVPVMSGDIGVTFDNAPGFDVMSTLSTSDIENITVIKDAAAAALYGSRAANGVIVITTKSGKKGKTVFNVKADMGFSDFAMPYRTMMSGQERRDKQIEGYRNYWDATGGVFSGSTNYTDVDDYITQNINGTAPIPWMGYFEDWDKVLFKTGSYSNYEASASGGNETMRTYASLGYANQEGSTINSGLERISGKFNLDWDATKKMTVGIKSLVSQVEQDVFSEGQAYTSPFYSSRRAVTPSDPVYNEDGTWNTSIIGSAATRNPKLAQTYNTKTQKVIRANNVLYAQYAILPELKYKASFSYDFNYSRTDSWTDPRTSDGASKNGVKSVYIYDYNKWQLSNSASYVKTFAEKHNLDALVAFEVEDYYRDYLYGSQSGFLDPELNAIANGELKEGISGSPNGWRMVSLVSRANYDYMGKYYAGVSFRYDGSSKLSKTDNKNWAPFWSVSGSWRVTEEDFMEDYKQTLSDLRIRASYGTSGTLPSDLYGFYGLSSLSADYKYMNKGGIASSQVANTNLTWEKNAAFNLGLDVQLFKRVNVSLEYYNRVTKDLLYPFPISYTTGYSTYFRNIGQLQNRGFEVDINSTNITTKDFTWSTRLNLGQNRNKVLKLDGDITELVSGHFIHKIGANYYTFYLVEFAGIDPEDGEPMFVKNKKVTDENGNVTIDKSTTKTYSEASRTEHKGLEPTLSGGLTNTLSYKMFDLSFQVNFNYGGYSYDDAAQKVEHGGADMRTTIPVYYADSWKKPGDKTDIERFIYGRPNAMSGYTTTRRMHSTDYVRLQNLTFGVNAPKTWLKHTGLSNVRLYTSGTNLLTWAKFDWYDPTGLEQDGNSDWSQPPLKTWTFGIDIKF
ncbi:MAG: TonB-dependent receptor [Candidatus Symbiothrix sp.]|jgi:TonB-linked SusC/RagA family outer membrane protein|nr:TonB-dependent receptor [Candidatus Symbiothrix sp.]